MRPFLFKAVDAKGKLVSGTSKARDIDDLTKILRGQGLFLMEARALENASAPAAAPAQKAEPPKKAAPSAPAPRPSAAPQGGPVRPADEPADAVSLSEIEQFTSQFAVMIRSSLPILESLTMLGQQQANPALRSALYGVAREIRDGQPLSRCFAKRPSLFDQVYVSLLAAGEASGQMPEMLDRISRYLRFRLEIRDKIRTALLYPAVIFATASAVVLFLVLFVVPVFADVFAQFEVPVPWVTRTLLDAGELLRSAWLPLLLGAGAAAWAARSWASSPDNAYKLQSMLLDAPAVGVVIRNVALTRSLRTLGALVASGVPILEALELSQAASGNAVFNKLLGAVRENVVQGRGLAKGLKGSPYVPDAVVGMIETGEKTGALPQVIEKIADLYEAQTDSAIRNLFALLEPAFVVTLGLMVGGVAVSILLPLFGLTNAVQ